MTKIERLDEVGRRIKGWNYNVGVKKSDKVDCKKGMLNSILLQFHLKIGVVRT